MDDLLYLVYSHLMDYVLDISKIQDRHGQLHNEAGYNHSNVCCVHVKNVIISDA